MGIPLAPCDVDRGRHLKSLREAKANNTYNWTQILMDYCSLDPLPLMLSSPSLDVKQTNKQVEHSTFHIVYRKSTPGFPQRATKQWWPRGSTLRPHSLLSGAPLARLAAPLDEWMDRTQCSMWVAASRATGPLSAGWRLHLTSVPRYWRWLRPAPGAPCPRADDCI